MFYFRLNRILGRATPRIAADFPDDRIRAPVGAWAGSSTYDAGGAGAASYFGGPLSNLTARV